MLFPPLLASPRELPGACALATNADRNKPVIKTKLRNVKDRHLFPFMNELLSFLVFNF